MGAAGGVVYMGTAFQMLAGGLRETLALSGRIGLSTGRTTVKDVPLLIKMLSVETEGIAAEAHKMLTALAGRDLGTEPGPWEAWWAEHSRVLMAHEVDCRNAAALFHEIMRDVLTGQWPYIHETLSARLRGEASAEDLGRRLAALSPTLRKAYRDAEVTGLRLEEGGGVLVVDWGVEGFAFTELPIVREGDGWRFAALPWSDELVVCPPKELKLAGGPVQRHRWRKSVFSTWLSWGPAAAVVATILVIVQLVLFGDRVPFLNIYLGAVAVVVGIACLVVFPVVVLVYVIFIRPLPNSRELRKETRRRRGR